MIRITQSEWDKIPACYKDTWTTERTDLPNWERDRQLYMGKRTWLHRGALQIEGLSFQITPDFAADEFMKLYSQLSAMWKDVINPKTRAACYRRLEEMEARADQAHDANVMTTDDWRALKGRINRFKNSIAILGEDEGSDK